METNIVKYDITDAAISDMKSIYMNLIITDLDDKEQFDSVHSARMIVKGKRVEIENRRKELKAAALAYGREVDSKAKEIFGKLEPIESHLEREERKVTDEQKRIKEEADRKEKEKIGNRIADLAKWGKHLPFFDVAGWTDGEFDSHLIIAKDDYEKEQKRLAEEEAARKAEAERLEAVRKEQEAEAARLKALNDKIIAEQKAAQDKIDASRKALEAEKDAERDRVYREGLARTAKEKAEKDVRERAEREAIKKIEAERKAKEEAERQEALKPDREKLLLYADKISGLTASNLSVVSDEARAIFHATLHNIMTIEKRLRQQIEEL